MKQQFILGLILASIILMGCTSQQPVENLTNTTPPPPPPPKTPTISITAPTEGQVMVIPEDTTEVTLTLNTQNLVLKPPGGAAKKGEGHFRVTVDSATPVTVTTKTYLISSLGVGTHTIKVELLNNDRTVYSPAISKEVTITIEKEKPKDYIPQSYTVTVQNFNYQPAEITVKVGDSITFVNAGNFPNSATCFLGARQIFDTNVLGHGQSATITFTDMGECQYYSTTNPSVKGKVTVESNGTEVQ